MSYFLQAPLRYTLPCILNWLVAQAQQLSAMSVYSHSKPGSVYIEVLQLLLTAESCPVQVRALFCTTVLQLVDDNSALSTLLKGTPANNTHLWPQGALGSALGPDSSAQDAASAFLQLRGPLQSAQYVLGAALDTDPQAASTRIICGVLGMDHPPFALAREALSLWDSSRASIVEIRNLIACYLQSAGLARTLPGGAETVNDVLAFFAHAGHSAVLRELLAGARPPLAALAGAVMNEPL